MRTNLAVIALLAAVVHAHAAEIVGDGAPAEASAAAPAATFSNFTDFAAFQGAFGAPLTQIRFDEIPPGSVLDDQYAAEHVRFVDLDDVTLAGGAFTRDGVGASGNGRIRLSFTQPARAIGAFFPGGLAIRIFDVQGGTLLHTSPNFGGTGVGLFGGVVSDAGFGFVELRDWSDDAAFLDDLVIGFGPAAERISGCFEHRDAPVAPTLVALVQPGQPTRFALTDASGCWAFDDPVPGAIYSIRTIGRLAQ